MTRSHISLVWVLFPALLLSLGTVFSMGENTCPRDLETIFSSVTDKCKGVNQYLLEVYKQFFSWYCLE